MNNNLKNFNRLFANVLLILFFSLTIQAVLGFAWYLVAPLLLAASMLPMPKGVLSAGIYREAWQKQMLDFITMSDTAAWLETGLIDLSSEVATVDEEMQVINLAKMGVLPDVLIDNTDYPIPEQDLGIDNIPIALNKYQTKVTPITDDELFGLSVDKKAAVIQRHGTAIRIQKFAKAAWNIAPANGATGAMPVLLTTGDDDGTGRKKLTWDDVSDFKRKINVLEWGGAGVPRFVFCSDHENDLITNDQRAVQLFYNRADGKPFNQLGFEFFSAMRAPYYNPTTKTRKSFGSNPAAGDQQASFIFMPNRVAKATGWTKMYYSTAEVNPSTQKTTINFRHHFIALPCENAYRGAIISDNAA